MSFFDINLEKIVKFSDTFEKFVNNYENLKIHCGNYAKNEHMKFSPRYTGLCNTSNNNFQHEVCFQCQFCIFHIPAYFFLDSENPY